MTDYVVLCPPGATVRTVENVAVDAPVLLERDKLEAWVQLQAALKAARDAGILTPGAELMMEGVNRVHDDVLDEDADPDATVLEFERRGKRVHHTPDLDKLQIVGKCGQGFHVNDKARIARHMQTCSTCRVDPRIEPLAR